MRARPGILLFICFLYGVSLQVAAANSRTVGFAGRKADKIEQKRFDKQVWAQPERSRLQEKTFPIEAWPKHYSPLGAKRAPISAEERSEKKLFETSVIEQKPFPLEFSRWDGQLADLHKQAGIDMDEEARIIAERQLYSMLLQDTRAYAELGDELSLRELNRFQFRRNRDDGDVPVQQAGAGD